MTSTPLPAQPGPAGARPAVGAPVAEARGTGPRRNLEEFWPSRREHAFDEHCR